MNLPNPNLVYDVFALPTTRGRHNKFVTLNKSYIFLYKMCIFLLKMCIIVVFVKSTPPPVLKGNRKKETASPKALEWSLWGTPEGLLCTALLLHLPRKPWHRMVLMFIGSPKYWDRPLSF